MNIEGAQIPENIPGECVRVERLPSKLFYSNGVFKIISGPLQYTFSEFQPPAPRGHSIQNRLERGLELGVKAEAAQLQERAAIRTNWIMMQELELKRRHRLQVQASEKASRFRTLAESKSLGRH